jgi:dolichol-phosphate mannosyltransferase
MNPEISIVIPFFNEGPNVGPLAREVFAALQNETRRLELVLVDDASTDETWQQMLQAQAEDERVRPIRLQARSGQSTALWSGFKASRGRIIATLDGDRQNDPADLPDMIARLNEYDVVCGVRRKREDNFVRRQSSRIARWARRVVLSIDFPDTGCNLRVFKRTVLETVLPFDGFHRFLPILALAGGAKAIGVPVGHRPRVAGRTKYGVWNRLGRGIKDLLMVKWYLKRRIKNIPMTEEPARPTTKFASTSEAVVEKGGTGASPD